MTALLNTAPEHGVGTDAVLGSAPASGARILTGLGEIERILDRLAAEASLDPASGQASVGHSDALRAVERVERRVASLRLRIIAAAHRHDTASRNGFTGTDAWTARQTGTPRATAARDVALAEALGSGRHEPAATALQAGALSPAHAAVIVSATDRLPTGARPDQRVRVQEALVAKAAHYDPEQLRRAARRALETFEADPDTVDAHENAQLVNEEAHARARAAFTLHDNGDGTSTGRFTLPALTAAILGKVIDSLTAPRRSTEVRHPGQGRHETSSDRTVDRAADPAAPKAWDWTHRRGLAFADLVTHLPTDHLHPKTAATVVVTIDLRTLTGALKAGHLDTGAAISAGEARRLACNAGLLPAVLGTGSVALDLGRETRLFTTAQRLAAGLRFEGCAADGCERPSHWCELHHLRPWSAGGRTDLDNAVPLCSWHHQRIHDPAFDHDPRPDGTIRFWRST